MTSTRLINLILIICSLFLLFYCDANPINSESLDLESAKAKWNNKRIYSYTINEKVDCFCLNAGKFFEITVSGNTINKVVNIKNGQELDPQYWSLFQTVDDLFLLIDSLNPESMAKFEVDYNKSLGYPSMLNLDYSSQIADEEINYTLNNLQIVGTYK
ncbi:MAG: hypothetical protein KKB34_02010 [Bacteroidetes bacterium]|nr:hypothetical protein [Bacteroidota bacterium]